MNCMQICKLNRLNPSCMLLQLPHQWHTTCMYSSVLPCTRRQATPAASPGLWHAQPMNQTSIWCIWHEETVWGAQQMVSEEEDVVASHSTSPRQCWRRPASVLFLFLGTHFPLESPWPDASCMEGPQMSEIRTLTSTWGRGEKQLRSWLAQDRSKTASSPCHATPLCSVTS